MERSRQASWNGGSDSGMPGADTARRELVLVRGSACGDRLVSTHIRREGSNHGWCGLYSDQISRAPAIKAGGPIWQSTLAIKWETRRRQRQIWWTGGPAKRAYLTSASAGDDGKAQEAGEIGLFLFRLGDEFADLLGLRNGQLVTTDSRWGCPGNGTGCNPPPANRLVHESAEERVNVLDTLRAERATTVPALTLEFRAKGVDIRGADRPHLRLTEPRQNAFFEETVVLVKGCR